MIDRQQAAKRRLWAGGDSTLCRIGQRTGRPRAPLVATYPLVTIVGSKLLQRKIEGGPGLAIGVALIVLGVVLLLAA